MTLDANSMLTRDVTKNFYKTALCRFFTNSKCNRYQDCPYAHGIEELRQLPDLSKTALCKKGETCNLSADQCPFAHDINELKASRKSLQCALSYQRDSKNRKEKVPQAKSSTQERFSENICKSDASKTSNDRGDQARSVSANNKGETKNPPPNQEDAKTAKFHETSPSRADRGEKEDEVVQYAVVPRHFTTA